MRKMLNKKGFTLAELLIVVAIIAVLVAIAIPVFTTQLEKSREATDLANIRSAYAGAVVEFLNDGSTDIDVEVPAKQTIAGWITTEHSIGVDVAGSGSGSAFAEAKVVPDFVVGKTWHVKITASTGAVDITCE